MNLPRASWVAIAISTIALACSNGSSNSGNCCNIGTGNPGVPACVCGTQTSDAGSCKVASTVGATCTISCNGATYGGQTTTSCSNP